MKENENENKKNKSMIIKKYKIEDGNLNSLMNPGFETSENYLKIDPNIIIGKIININYKSKALMHFVNY